MEKDIERRITTPANTPPPYRFVTRGAVTHIAEQSGAVVSDQFHEFTILEAKDTEGNVLDRGITARLGSLMKIVRLPSGPGERFESLTTGYHDIEFRADLGAFTGTLGSYVYLLDTQGNRLTTGHHSLFVEDGVLYGKRGAAKENLGQMSRLKVISASN